MGGEKVEGCVDRVCDKMGEQWVHDKVHQRGYLIEHIVDRVN